MREAKEAQDNAFHELGKSEREPGVKEKLPRNDGLKIGRSKRGKKTGTISDSICYGKQGGIETGKSQHYTVSQFIPRKAGSGGRIQGKGDEQLRGVAQMTAGNSFYSNWRGKARLG